MESVDLASCHAAQVRGAVLESNDNSSNPQGCNMAGCAPQTDDGCYFVGRSVICVR